MTVEARSRKNWFAQGGETYARYRPDYPDELAAFLAQTAPATQVAVDVGCGNGQFTRQLAAHFASVIGVDPSRDQLASAAADPRIRYVCAPAEDLGPIGARASLVTAAQAAHWFDLPRFYGEVRATAEPGAILALVSYGVPEFDAQLDDRFQRFYRDEIGAYWPPERQLVESGYADIAFPFRELAYPPMEIRRDWDLPSFLGYVATWSATRRVEEAGRADIVTTFAADLEQLWGSPQQTRLVRWPIKMRLGVI